MSLLSDILYKAPMVGSGGLITRPWAQFFAALIERIGGAGEVLTIQDLHVLITEGEAGPNAAFAAAGAAPQALDTRSDLGLAGGAMQEAAARPAQDAPGQSAGLQTLRQDLTDLALGRAVLEAPALQASVAQRLQDLEGQALLGQEWPAFQASVAQRLQDLEGQALLGQEWPAFQAYVAQRLADLEQQCLLSWPAPAGLGYATSTWEDTFTITATGFTASVTGTAKYIRAGHVVTLWTPLLFGTSNATTFTLTGLPAAITPVNSAFFYAVASDNGVGVRAVGFLLAGSTTITLSNGPASGALWTASGGKALQAITLTYLLI